MTSQYVTHDELSGVLERLDGRFDVILEWFKTVNQRLDVIDKRLDGMDRRLSSLEAEVRDGFRRVDEGFEGMSHNFGWMDKRLRRIEGVHELPDDLAVALWQPSGD